MDSTRSNQSQSSGNQSQGSGNRSRTGVSDEAYDLMVTLTNKLQELWRLDDFINDSNRQGDRGLWERMRDHDREDVEALLTALKRALGSGGSGSHSSGGQGGNGGQGGGSR